MRCIAEPRSILGATVEHRTGSIVSGDVGILTLAFGNKRYVEMALALARSIRHHGSKVPLAVVTDTQFGMALGGAYDVIIPRRTGIGKGLRHKLFLDHYTPFRQTLFLDADCLVFGNIDQVLPKYSGVIFGVGSPPSPKTMHYHMVKDLPGLLKFLDCRSIPHINGGLYWFTDAAAPVFAAARQFDESVPGLSQYMDTAENDEVQFAVALRRVGIEPYCPSPHVVSNVCGRFEGLHRVNVLTGRSEYIRDGKVMSAPILHFLWGLTRGFTYRRETARLRGRHLPLPLRELIAIGDAIPGIRLEWRRTRFGRKAAAMRPEA